MKHLSFVWTAIVLLTVSYLSLTVGSAKTESLTYDEIVHIEEGISAWKKHTFAVDTNNPPLIRELAVVPILLNNATNWKQTPNQTVFAARMVIVFLSVVLGIAVFFVTNSFFGLTSAVFATALFSVDPNILANNHYVTQDLGAALWFFLGYTSLILMLRSPTWKLFLWHGFCMGCLLATKITLIPYYALSSLTLVPFMLGKETFMWFKKYPFRILASVTACIVVLWATYFFAFNVIVVPNATNGRVSDKIRTYAQSTNNQLLLQGLHFLQYQPVPLGDYIAVIKNTVIRSTLHTPTFFLGTYYRDPKWYFMFINFLLKTPIPLLLLSVIGTIVGLRHPFTRTKTIYILIPLASICIFSIVTPIQPFVRYILPVYPFLFILGGLAYPNTHSVQKYAVLLLYAWCIVGTFYQYPSFISYANEFAGERSSRYRLFTDSNIDWGQGLVLLSHALEEQKPSHIAFSYFGRDDATGYGFTSTLPFGSYKSDEICAFHEVSYPQFSGASLTIISVSNWYSCGYHKQSQFSSSRILSIFADSFLIFSK